MYKPIQRSIALEVLFLCFLINSPKTVLLHTHQEQFASIFQHFSASPTSFLQSLYGLIPFILIKVLIQYRLSSQQQSYVNLFFPVPIIYSVLQNILFFQNIFISNFISSQQFPTISYKPNSKRFKYFLRSLVYKHAYKFNIFLIIFFYIRN